MNILIVLFAAIVAFYHLDVAKKTPLHRWHLPVVMAMMIWIAFWGLLGPIARLVSPAFLDAIAQFRNAAVMLPAGLLVCSLVGAGYWDLFKYGRRFASLPVRFLVQLGAGFGLFFSVWSGGWVVLKSLGAIA